MTRHRLFYITPITKERVECIINWLGLTNAEELELESLSQKGSIEGLSTEETRRFKSLGEKRNEFGVTYIEGKGYKGAHNVINIDDKESYELVEV